MRWRVLGLVVLVSGCGAPAPSAGHAAASTVEHPIGEGELPTVTLTPEAVARLGIETASVEDDAVISTRLVGGEVIVPPGRTATVTAAVAGIVHLAAESPTPGTAVVRGQVLARITALATADRDVHARAAREVAAAEATLVTAEARVTRNEALVAEGAGSTRLLEEAVMARDVARADADVARAREATIRRAPLLSDVVLTVRAPEDGIVRTLAVTEGQAVPPGAPLFEIVAVDALEVRVPVYVGDLARLDGTSTARARRLGSDTSFELVPAAGPPTAEPDRLNVDRYFTVGGSTALVPGERVLVELPLTSEASARSVPTSSIVLDAWGGVWVYVCDETPGRYVRQRVDPGRRSGERTVIAHGPATGTCVVSTGAADVFGAEFAPGH